jgi:hypothetical protein
VTPARKLGGEVFAGRDRDDLVIGPVEEEDRKPQRLRVIERVEVAPVGVDPGSDRPLHRLRRALEFVKRFVPAT